MHARPCPRSNHTTNRFCKDFKHSKRATALSLASFCMGKLYDDEKGDQDNIETRGSTRDGEERLCSILRSQEAVAHMVSIRPSLQGALPEIPIMCSSIMNCIPVVCPNLVSFLRIRHSI